MTNIGNMYGPNFTFLGIPRCDLDKPESYKGADVIIVGAPIDSGTSHRSGAKMGPQAIRMGDYLPHDGSRPHPIRPAATSSGMPPAANPMVCSRKRRACPSWP